MKALALYRDAAPECARENLESPPEHFEQMLCCMLYKDLTLSFPWQSESWKEESWFSMDDFLVVSP
jgi:hypothetical protein